MVISRPGALLKYVSLIVIGWVALPDFVNGQQRSAPGTGVLALVDKIKTYSNHHLQEKIFVHTDRGFYLAGETAWFRIYCVDGSFHRPSGVSNVAYLEVLDANHDVVLQTKLELNDEGIGSGSLFIPLSVKSGNCVIRAYTNWMKNFDPDLYFETPVGILNPFTQFSVAPSTAPDYDVQFFPEGGDLVNDLISVVGFRVVDRNGHGVSFHGTVLNETNDTIARISPHKFGIGKFAFTPSQDHVYRAVLTFAGNKKNTYRLPASRKDGMVLHLEETDNKVLVRVNAPTSGSVSSMVYLLAHTRQKTIVYDTRPMTGGEARFAIDKNMLGDGITHITIFNDQLMPVCERLFFKKPAQVVNISMKLSSDVFGLRKKVTIDLQSGLPEGKKTAVNLSASVFRIDSLGAEGGNIVNYLLLASELKGNIESPGYYFESENTTERVEATDNLMLTHGWARFKWEDVLVDRPIEGFVPEYNGHMISAQIRESSGMAPAKGIQAYLTAAGPYTRPYVSRSNAAGKLLFETRNFYGSNELVVQTNTLFDSTYSIEVVSPFSEKKSSRVVPGLDLKEEKSENAIRQRSIHLQVQNIFNKDKRTLVYKPAFDSLSFYGHADAKFNLDDYTRFPTMEEVMREYVKGVQVRKHKDGFHFLIFDNVTWSFFPNNPPLVMLDGVPVFDINKIIAFDPRKVKSVEVVSRRCYLGVAAFDGIISYRSYQGDLGGFQLDPRTLVVSYEGMQIHREFFSPVYETEMQRNSKVPDSRSLLFWSPTVYTGQDGKGQIEFFTSDLQGKYKIVVQGMSKDGIPGYSSASFEVKKK